MLKALVDYYEYLIENDVEGIARPGWSPARVSALVEIAKDGSLVGIIPSEERRGWTKHVPRRVERSSGIRANLLCDTSSYIFGIDAKGNPQRAVDCFEAMREKNTGFLQTVDSDAARAVLGFFKRWNLEKAKEHPVIKAHEDSIFSGGNLAFSVEGRELLGDDAIRRAVDRFEAEAGNNVDEDTIEMRCLVTGEIAPIARLHPKIKGVLGAQSSGAALVSFNAPSFESYGRNGEQGLNAPVSEYAAFAYTTALNYLLSDPLHHVRIGNTMIVYWSLEEDYKRSTIFRQGIDPSFCLRGLGGANKDDAKLDPVEEARETDKALDSMMNEIALGKLPDDLRIGVPFFVLGVDPNAARVSVRFFMQNTLEAFLNNISKHYERMRIIHAPYQSDYLSPYRLVREVENPNSKESVVSNILVGSLIRSILSNEYYPVALYQNAILRTRVTQDDSDKGIKKVSYGRAAIIKAYLIKNYGLSEEDLAMDQNAENESIPCLLGRLFGILESAQVASAALDNRKLNSTIVDRYFDSACATPAVVFPGMTKLVMKHVRKLEKAGKGFGYDEQITGIYKKNGMQTQALPARLTIEEQGIFIMNYYIQHQKKFIKRTDENNTAAEG